MATFDLNGLFRAIDRERRRQGLSWASLAREVGVSASTIRRYCDADDAEADGVLALVRWLGVAPEDLIEGGSVAGAKLPSPDGGFVRVDMDLIAVATGDREGAGEVTRTTIQRLVEAANSAESPVVELTRLSDV